VINTTTLSYLPFKVILDEVWFGRKAWGPLLKVMDNGDEITDFDESDQEKEEDPNNEDETFLLSELLELNRRVTEKNVKVTEKMVVKGGPKTTFIVGQFVTLVIPPKNRLSTEGNRLPCRIVKSVRGAYTLLCIHGLLRGLHQGVYPQSSPG
jgi:hypothetical protein